MKTKAIITKYAVTSGIKLAFGRVASDGGMLSVGENGNWVEYYHGSDFHTTSATARQDVKSRFERKRSSLEGQLQRLDGKLQHALELIDAADMP